MSTVHLIIPFNPHAPRAEGPTATRGDRGEAIEHLFKALREVPGITSLEKMHYFYGHPVVPWGVLINITASMSKRDSARSSAVCSRSTSSRRAAQSAAASCSRTTTRAGGRARFFSPS